MNKKLCRYKAIDGIPFLTIEIKKGFTLTERELYAINNGEFASILQVQPEKKGFGGGRLHYALDGLVTLQDYLLEPVDKELFFKLISSILSAVQSINDAVYNVGSLLLDADYIFVDPENGKALLVYIPIAGYDCETDLPQLLQSLLSFCSFDQNEDTQYVQRYIEILSNGAAFSVFAMEQYVQDLEKEISRANRPKLCPACGKQIPPPFGFCPDCGVALVETDAEDTSVPVTVQDQEAFLFRERTGEWSCVDKLLRLGKSRMKNDYCIADVSTISRNHAVIEWCDGNWYLTDLKSTNGTFINGREIPQETKVMLSTNDRVRLANEDFIFEIRQ